MPDKSGNYKGRRPLASVVIVAGGDAAGLRRCLDFVQKCTSVRHEVIVAGRVNEGIRRARGAYIAVLNSAALVSPEWLERMIRRFEEDPGTGMVVPRDNQSKAIDRGAELCMLVRRDAVLKVGLMDERLEAEGRARSDYCMRIWQAGRRIARSDDAFVFHFGRESRPDKSGNSRPDKSGNYYGKDPNPTDGARPQNGDKGTFAEKWCGNVIEFWDDLDSVFRRI